MAQEPSVAHLFNVVGRLVELPETEMWLDYDVKADVLYALFEETPVATYSETREDGIVLDYNQKDVLVRLTIPDVSQR